MSKVVTDTERQTGDAVPQSPPDLYDVVRTGALFAGEAVVEVVIVTASGRRQKLQLPTPADKKGVGLSRSKRKIMDALRASPVPMTRLAVAHRCNLEDATGRFGINVRELLADGVIYSNGDDITDDPGKFN